MKVLFSGGGTLGPVTPLLAIKDTMQEAYPDAKFLWVGTKTGPERDLITKAGIRFTTLSSGKFRRYLSLWNVVDVFRIIIGFFQSIKILWKENPDMCISAGGFISVPLHWAAWFMGVPTWIHQQDVDVGLANRLMAPCAKQITTGLEKNVLQFSKNKTVWLGNPVRSDILKGDVKTAQKLFGLEGTLPVVFATGGGTGSLRVNQMIVEAAQHLEGYAQIIHLSGLERPQELVSRASTLYKYYHTYQFFTEEMKHAYAVADIIISRGGFGTLSEIAALGKPAIIIPKGGHQEENVKFLEKEGAIIHVDESLADGLYLAKTVRELLGDEIRRKQLGNQLRKMLPRTEDRIVLRIIDNVLNK
jgi:UDP-N-acetylglucosamine--N-acetylmuramyl-(pentapeptide) pyrophosphoryl-undecaprenol N-acetylglucosamine transferase